MQAYLPSQRMLGKLKAPVLIKAGELGGDWLPPMRVYLASDVDKELERLRADNERLRASNRLLQQRDDYVSGCLV